MAKLRSIAVAAGSTLALALWAATCQAQVHFSVGHHGHRGHHGHHHHHRHHHHPHFSFGLDLHPHYYPPPYYGPRYYYVPAPVYAPVYTPYAPVYPLAAQPQPAAVATTAAAASSPQPTLAQAPTRLEVKLPDPEGDVWIDGRKATGSGTTRTYQFAAGANEKSRTVKVTAAWHENGRLVSRERTIDASAGQTTEIDLGETWTEQPPVLSSKPKDASR